MLGLNNGFILGNIPDNNNNNGAVLGFCAKTGANAPIERSDMPPQIGNSVSIDFTKEIRFN